MVAVSCEYLLTVFENLECIFDEKGETAVVAELYCCWNDGDVPQSFCVVAVSCEYLLAVFENLEFIFSEQGEAAVVAELSN